MQHRHRETNRARRGVAYIAAMVMLSVFCVIAMAMTEATNISLVQGDNCRRAAQARLAAESGLAYAVMLLRDCESEPTLLELPDMLEVVRDHLVEKLPNNTVTLYEEDPGDPTALRKVTVADVLLPGGQSCLFEVYVSEADEDGHPTALQLLATGWSGGISRTVGVRFDVELNKKLLHYAFVSSVRIIARGNVKIYGPISSSWGRQLIPIENDPDEDYRNHHVRPLDVDLGSEGFIDGTLGTTLSEEDFTGDAGKGDSDFHTGIHTDNPAQDLLAQMSYEEPEVTHLKTEDFDTAPLKAMTATANLPAPDATGVSLGMWGLYGDRWENHDGQAKPALHDICVPKGTNPHFKNCTFTGITYIEVDEQTDNPTSGNQNGVVFENCTFEGPIITGVPKRMRWDYNSMEFRGVTRFRTSMIQAALGGVTLMAPNYNVNIGGSEGGGGSGDSDVCGLVIGGVVDLYNDISVHGTVISMAEIVDDEGSIIMGRNLSWLTGTGVCGANIGNLDGSSNNVHITPDPDNVIPLGIKKRYVVNPRADSYEEFPG
jgi:hypothetical protein